MICQNEMKFEGEKKKKKEKKRKKKAVPSCPPSLSFQVPCPWSTSLIIHHGPALPGTPG